MAVDSPGNVAIWANSATGDAFNASIDGLIMEQEISSYTGVITAYNAATAKYTSDLTTYNNSVKTYNDALAGDKPEDAELSDIGDKPAVPWTPPAYPGIKLF